MNITFKRKFGQATVVSKQIVRQRGFISIFSVLIIMSVLTLIMVGFSQLVRRASITNLNDQLSTQAFYAAESGVNEAITWLATKPATTSPDKDQCTSGGSGSFAYGDNLDASLKIGYSCILITGSAQDIRFKNVPLQGSGIPKTARIESDNPAKSLSQFDITLNSSSGSTTPATSSGFVPEPSRIAPEIGVLRVELVPVSGSLDRGNLINNSYTFFVNFNNTGAAVTATVNAGAAGGDIVSANCSVAPIVCKTTIKLSNLGFNSYVMRLQAIYSNVDVVVNNFQDGNNKSLTLKNGQQVVDVTGQANGVYRRIQVRLRGDRYPSPPYALQTADSICKRLLVAPAPETTGTDSSVGACLID